MTDSTSTSTAIDILTTKRGNPAWTKGVSGNPGGRPKAELTGLFRAHAMEALGRCVQHMRSTDPVISLKAIQIIFERSYGKPRELHELDAEVRVGLSPEMRARIIDAICIMRSASTSTSVISSSWTMPRK